MSAAPTSRRVILAGVPLAILAIRLVAPARGFDVVGSRAVIDGAIIVFAAWLLLLAYSLGSWALDFVMRWMLPVGIERFVLAAALGTGKGQKAVSFRPSLAAAGIYEVYLRWTSSGNRATNVPVTIVTATNNAVLRIVNQQVNGARWNSLGLFDLSSATALLTIANSNTTGHVIVDAVQFSKTAVSAVIDDRDDDGLADWWERWYFLSEIAASVAADPDSDGLSNLQECLTGTDPLDPSSRFVMRAVLDDVPPRVLLSWPSTTNRTYRIEVSDDMQAFPLHRAAIPATPPLNSETVQVLGGRQFFRVVAE